MDRDVSTPIFQKYFFGITHLLFLVEKQMFAEKIIFISAARRAEQRT